jgi:four helix bundle protein
MNEVELKDRAKVFALRVIKLVDALPRSATGDVIGRQLLRSSTSVAANYRAACRARSGPDFVNKLGVVEEEADESVFWLEMIRDAGLLPETNLTELLKESNELTAIFTASHITAKRSQSSPNRYANRKSE